MPGVWDISLALDPYAPFPTAIVPDASGGDRFRWAAITPDDVRYARQATAAAGLGGAPGYNQLTALQEQGLNIGSLLAGGAAPAGGQVAPASGGQFLPNYQYVEPELWNSMSPELQSDVLLYGWPLKRPEAQPDSTTRALEQAMALRQLQSLTQQNQAARVAAQREQALWDQPEAVARGVDPELSGQALLNAMWLARGLDPRTVYGYDPEWERQQANRDYYARMSALAQSLASTATGTEMDVWNQRTRWALPEAGALYSLQQPGGMIDSIFSNMGWAYNPTPAQHLPAPDPWANYRRAMAEVM